MEHPTDPNEKHGTKKIASYWYNSGISIEPIAKEGKDFGMSAAWGILEKKALQGSMHHLWMEFNVYGEKIEDLAVV